MPDRVKCLHVLVAHALGVGAGVNPFGDEVVDAARQLGIRRAVRRGGRAGWFDRTVTRVAAMDCGTNSLRLLVADVDGRQLTDVVRRMEIVRLGEGVDRTGRLSDAALERTFRVLDDYAEVIDSHDVDRVRMVATSASRDAANRDVFVGGVVDRVGVAPEVISGDDEAELSFAGATRELRGGGATARAVPRRGHRRWLDGVRHRRRRPARARRARSTSAASG